MLHTPTIIEITVFAVVIMKTLCLEKTVSFYIRVLNVEYWLLDIQF